MKKQTSAYQRQQIILKRELKFFQQQLVNMTTEQERDKKKLVESYGLLEVRVRRRTSLLMNTCLMLDYIL